MLGKVLRYGILLVCVVIMGFPFYYMAAVSFATDQQVFWFPIPIIPHQISLVNYVRIWAVAPFGRFFINSLIMAGSITLLHLIFDPLAGYVFAKFRFPGREPLFLVILGTLMIPFFLRMIPMYWVTVKLGWLNTYQGLIVPFASSAYGIFLMRQFILPLPTELLDAARVDGASELRIFISIVFPQFKPALASVALFTFVFQWNNFLWPLLATSSNRLVVLKSLTSLSDIARDLAPYRDHLSTLGIGAADHEYDSIARDAQAIGFTRVCSLGNMQTPPLVRTHDGKMRLASLL